MRVLVIGKGALLHSLSRNIARNAMLYSISDQRNPDVIRISEKSFIWKKLTKQSIAVWAIKEKVDVAYISKHLFSVLGVYEELTRAGIEVIGANAFQAKNTTRKKIFEIAEKNNVKIPEYEVYEGRLTRGIKDFLSDEGTFIIREAERFFELEDEKVAVELSAKDVPKYLEDKFKEKKETLIIEKTLKGIEISLSAFTDGKNISFAFPVQSTRRAFEGDVGAITDSLGGYSTGAYLPFLKDNEKMKDMIRKMLKGYKGYRGAVTAHFVLNKELNLVDFQLGFGTVEGILTTELLINPLTEVFEKILDNNCKEIAYKNLSAIVKFAVPNGYPIIEREQRIHINEKELWKRKVIMFMHNIHYIENKIFTGKGRTLALFSKSERLEEAYENVEWGFSHIKGPIWHRKDIGKKEIIKEQLRKLNKIKRN